MKDITEDYVSFETSKLLKAKGFNEKCLRTYFGDGNISRIFDDNDDIYNENLLPSIVAAPTLQMAMKWLREKHHIVIDVCLEDYITEVDGSLTITYTYTIWYFNRHLSHTGGTDIRYTDATVDGEEKNSYEEACEAAIKYCLENLI